MCPLVQYVCIVEKRRDQKWNKNFACKRKKKKKDDSGTTVK